MNKVQLPHLPDEDARTRSILQSLIQAMLELDWLLRPSTQDILSAITASHQPYVDVVVSELSPKGELYKSQTMGTSPHFLLDCYVGHGVLKFLSRLDVSPDHLLLRLKKDDEFWSSVNWAVCW
jgi:hypothetical protein